MVVERDDLLLWKLIVNPVKICLDFLSNEQKMLPASTFIQAMKYVYSVMHENTQQLLNCNSKKPTVWDVMLPGKRKLSSREIDPLHDLDIINKIYKSVEIVCSCFMWAQA